MERNWYVKFLPSRELPERLAKYLKGEKIIGP